MIPLSQSIVYVLLCAEGGGHVWQDWTCFRLQLGPFQILQEIHSFIIYYVRVYYGLVQRPIVYSINPIQSLGLFVNKNGNQPIRKQVQIVTYNYINVNDLEYLQMTKILNNEYSDKLSSYTVIDCRYPYEYKGGHIQVTCCAYLMVYLLIKCVNQMHRNFVHNFIQCFIYGSREGGWKEPITLYSIIC